MCYNNTVRKNQHIYKTKKSSIQKEAIRMETELTLTRFLLAIMLGTLLAIVYSMRKLIILERYIARIETHIEKVSKHILREETLILKKKK